MNTPNDGGPAFPRASWDGMALRDYFAGQALVGVTLHLCRVNESVYDGGVQEGDLGGVAADCYGIADAMLRAREEGGAS